MEFVRLSNWNVASDKYAWPLRAQVAFGAGLVVGGAGLIPHQRHGLHSFYGGEHGCGIGHVPTNQPAPATTCWLVTGIAAIPTISLWLPSSVLFVSVIVHPVLMPMTLYFAAVLS